MFVCLLVGLFVRAFVIVRSLVRIRAPTAMGGGRRATLLIILIHQNNGSKTIIKPEYVNERKKEILQNIKLLRYFLTRNLVPMATNVVFVVSVLVHVLVGDHRVQVGCCYEIFKMQRLFHFITDRH